MARIEVSSLGHFRTKFCMHDLSKSASLCIFSLIAIALMTLHGSWFDADQRVPFWDQYRYLEMSERAYDVLESAPVSGAALDLHASHPPLYSLSGAIAMRLTKADFAHARFINLTWTLCLLLATYALARQFMRRGHSLIAVALAGFAPLTTSFAHLYYIETMLAPLVICGWWLLLASNHLRRWPHVIGLAVILGLGCLTKWTFPIFLALPIAVEMRHLVKSKNLAKVAALVGIPLLIAGPWYFFHFDDILEFFNAGVTGGEGYLSSRRGLRQYSFYIEEIILVGLGIPCALFAAFGMLRLYRRHPQRAQSVLIVLGIAVPILVFTLILTKKPRHLLPILPLFAILASFGISTIARMGIRRALAAFLVVHVGLCTANASFHGMPKLRLWGYQIPYLSVPSPTPGAPDSKNWPYLPILEQAMNRPQADELKSRGTTQGLVLFNLVPFREVGFRYHLKRQKLDASFSLVPMYWPEGHQAENPFPMLRSDFETPGLIDADVVIAKSGITWVRYGNQHTPGRFGAVISEALRQPRGPLASAFTRITDREGIACPDGSRAWIFTASAHPERAQAIAKFALRWQPGLPAAWEALGEATPAASSTAMAQRLEALGVRPTGWHAALQMLADPASGNAAELVSAERLIQAALQLPDREDLWRDAARELPKKLSLAKEISDVLRLWESSRINERFPDSAIQLAHLHLKSGRRACALAWARRALEDNGFRNAQAVTELMRGLGEEPPQGADDLLEWMQSLQLAAPKAPR